MHLGKSPHALGVPKTCISPSRRLRYLVMEPESWFNFSPRIIIMKKKNQKRRNLYLLEVSQKFGEIRLPIFRMKFETLISIGIPTHLELDNHWVPEWIG